VSGGLHAPNPVGCGTHIGGCAVTAGIGIEEQHCAGEGRRFTMTTRHHGVKKALADRLAEAVWQGAFPRARFGASNWEYAAAWSLTKFSCIRGEYKGIQEPAPGYRRARITTGGRRALQRCWGCAEKHVALKLTGVVRECTNRGLWAGGISSHPDGRYFGNWKNRQGPGGGI